MRKQTSRQRRQVGENVDINIKLSKPERGSIAYRIVIKQWQ